MTTTFQTNITDTEYNGWTNYETWNVALWIGNNEGLYNIAKQCRDYAEFQEIMIDDFGKSCTPDGVLWNDAELNHIELDELIEDL